MKMHFVFYLIKIINIIIIIFYQLISIIYYINKNFFYYYIYINKLINNKNKWGLEIGPNSKSQYNFYGNFNK